MAKSKKFYVVKKGLKTGIFEDYEEAKKYNEAGAPHSFNTREEAEDYLYTPLPVNIKGNESAIILDDGDIHISIDGSCKVTEENFIIAWAYIVYQNGKKIEEDSGYEINPDYKELRNDAAEIKAALEAVQWIKNNQEEYRNEDVFLYYDYNNIGLYLNGVYGLGKNEFKKNAITEMKKHLDLFHLVEVTGHSKIKINNDVHTLVNKALDRGENFIQDKTV